MSTSCSMFSQILKLIPRTQFQSLAKETKAEFGAKGLMCWTQMVAMLFCHLGRANSLREIEGGMKCAEGKLSHLGVEAPARSSLAYANAHRPWQLYEKVFQSLYATVSATVKGPRKFKFKNKLVSMDSTVIDVCLSMYDWAKFRRTKGAVKLHLVLDHDGYLPCFGVITEGAVHDVKVAQQIQFAPGTVVVDDRGYNDFGLFGRWQDEGVYFVTRMKDNTRYEVVGENAFPEKSAVVSDQTIRLTGEGAKEKCPHLLRRIEVVREDTGTTLVFLTNHLKLAATTVAAVYKERWQIELFFKTLKQNLKVKTFVGTSSNAVRIQIWTALIAIMLLKFLQLQSKFGWSMSNLVALLRMNLFTHRDLMTWLNDPFNTPPLPQDPQLRLLPE